MPLALAAPAALASLAYVNAKTGLWFDTKSLTGDVILAKTVISRTKSARLNSFYFLEEYALSRTHANKNLLLFEGKQFTYATVYDKVLRYGNWFKTKRGIKSGDIVAMNFQNSEHFIFIWWGLWSIGAKPAFINYNLNGRPLIHCIKEAGTNLCIVDTHVAEHTNEEVRNELPNVDFVVLTPEVETEILAMDPVRAPDEERAETEMSTLAILIYTSGTTGLPKAAIVSWAKCLSGGHNGSYLLKRGKDVMYTVGLLISIQHQGIGGLLTFSSLCPCIILRQLFFPTVRPCTLVPPRLLVASFQPGLSGMTAAP